MAKVNGSKKVFGRQPLCSSANTEATPDRLGFESSSSISKKNDRDGQSLANVFLNKGFDLKRKLK